MSQETITALIGIVPQVLLIAVVAAVLYALWRPILENVLPRVSRVSLLGIGVDLQPAQVRQALEEQGGPTDRPMPTDAALSAIAARAKRNADAIRGRTVVWIDDHPEWNRTERVVLHRIGVFVEPVRTAQEARSVIRAGLGDGPVDVLISDIQADAGSRLAEVTDMAREQGSVPVIVYVAQLREGVPGGAFGITNRPGELWHLVMDALERNPAAR